MTSKEALRALGEMMIPGSKEIEHAFEAADEIMDKEVPLKENDKELDASWQQRHSFNYQDDNGGD